MHSTSPPPSATPRLWHVGTLTYTAGGLAALFVWLLLGDFAWAMRERSVTPMAQWYLGTLLSGLPSANLVFLLLMSSFPAALGLILVPIISVMSDRHRGPRGRRIPFLLITTPLSALGMIFLGLTPWISSTVHAAVPGLSEVGISIFCFAVAWAVFEFAAIASGAVFGGLLNDVVPPELLGRFHGMFRMVSLIDGMIVGWWIMGLIPTHYALLFISIGTFYGSAFFLTCLNIKEGTYPEPPPIDPNRKGFWAQAQEYGKLCFSNRYYLTIFFMLLFNGLTAGPVNLLANNYRQSVGMSMEDFGKIQTMCYAISFCLGLPLGWLADLIHPLRLTMITVALYGLSCIWGAMYATTHDTFWVAIFVHNVISGCIFTSAASLGQRLFPRSSYAQFASAAGILGSLVGIVFPLMLGAMVDMSGWGYPILSSTAGKGGMSGMLHDFPGRHFEYTFAVGAFMCVMALGMGFFVHRRFMALGGPKGYVAPE
ncbi:MFS transporter [Verrucomicrobia bacterium LW23]|nr:MFS transporter [Verrucomicrobia bacterium LW23]